MNKEAASFQKFTKEQIESIDNDVLVTLFLNLQSQLETSLLNYQELLELNKELNIKIEQQTELISDFINNRFGRKTEKIDLEQPGVHQLDFSEILNEAEKSIETVYVIEPDVDEVVAPVKRGKRVGKRDADLKGLETKVIAHELTEGELLEMFGKEGFKVLPDEIYKKLHYTPASVYVEEHHIKVYAGMDNKTIVRANRPGDLLSNSLATPSLVAGVIEEKYVKHVPLYRQEQDFGRKGINISRQTMSSWVIRCYERYLSFLISGMKAELINQPILQADETVVEVTKDGRPAGTESRMWVYRSGKFSDRTVILYDYQKTRGYEHLEKYLDGFKGILVSDAYSAYEKLDKEHDEITMSACWAHARRRFSEAEKAIGSKKKDVLIRSVAHQALLKIAKMYKIEGELSGAPPDERLKIRTERIRPLVDEFFEWLKEKKNSGEILPSGKTAKGIEYCLNHETYLRVFLSNPFVPMDNNATEQALRSFCIGRNNWKIIDSISGAEASAGIYSIIETAKANGLIPYKYLEYLLSVLQEATIDKDMKVLDDLLPWSEKIPKECRL